MALKTLKADGLQGLTHFIKNTNFRTKKDIMFSDSALTTLTLSLLNFLIFYPHWIQIDPDLSYEDHHFLQLF